MRTGGRRWRRHEHSEVADFLGKNEVTGSPQMSVRGRKRREGVVALLGQRHHWAGPSQREKGRWREVGRARVGPLLLGCTLAHTGEGEVGRGCRPGREGEWVHSRIILFFPENVTMHIPIPIIDR